MADARHVVKYWKCYNTPTDGTIGTKLGWSNPLPQNYFLSIGSYWALTVIKLLRFFVLVYLKRSHACSHR